MPQLIVSYLALQFKEIDEHKYYMSQREQREVNWREAVNDWTMTHAARFHENYFQHTAEIEQACREKCPGGCRGIAITAEGEININSCPMEKSDLHKLLKDG